MPRAAAGGPRPYPTVRQHGRAHRPCPALLGPRELPRCVGRLGPLRCLLCQDLRLIRSLTLQIGRHFGPICPVPLTFHGVTQGVQLGWWTGVQRSFVRVLDTRSRPDLCIVRDQHLHSAKRVIIRPSTRPFPPHRDLTNSFGRDTEARRGLSVREPVWHPLERALDGRRTGVHGGCPSGSEAALHGPMASRQAEITAKRRKSRSLAGFVGSARSKRTATRSGEVGPVRRTR